MVEKARKIIVLYESLIDEGRKKSLIRNWKHKIYPIGFLGAIVAKGDRPGIIDTPELILHTVPEGVVEVTKDTEIEIKCSHGDKDLRVDLYLAKYGLQFEYPEHYEKWRREQLNKIKDILERSSSQLFSLLKINMIDASEGYTFLKKLNCDICGKPVSSQDIYIPRIDPILAHKECLEGWDC